MAGAQIDHIVVTVRDLAAAAATFQQLGFAATPRAHHGWGTDNQLVQFAGQNFIELVEVAKPEMIPDADPNADPPHFSFGTFNLEFLENRQGMSMLVLASKDAPADRKRIADAGLQLFHPFGFGRKAPQPDGTSLDVGFELTFTKLPGIEEAGFFTCHNLYPENFWKPVFQSHDNQAHAIVEVVMVAQNAAEAATGAAGFAGSTPQQIDGGYQVPCDGHLFTILSPDGARARYPQISVSGRNEFIAATISTTSLDSAQQAVAPAQIWPTDTGFFIRPTGLDGFVLEFAQA